MVVGGRHARNGIMANEVYSPWGAQKGVMIIAVR
jgi:hypothetical protein